MSKPDDSVGLLYHDFVGPYPGVHGDGAEKNKFFPAPSALDWSENFLQDYKDFFSLPHNERYYEKVIGRVHFFFVDTDENEPDGVSETSIQAEWIRAKMLLSTALWKIVILFDSPYSSVRSKEVSRWPFKSWGAHMVISGSVKNYERFNIAGLTFINNGLGGNGPIEAVRAGITISGAGITDVNGNLQVSTYFNGKPIYTNGTARFIVVDGFLSVITGTGASVYWTGFQWYIGFVTSGSVANYYVSTEDVATPDAVTGGWEPGLGDFNPPPVVTLQETLENEVGYDGGFGAGRITATDTTLLYEFVAVDGTIIDSIQLSK